MGYDADAHSGIIVPVEILLNSLPPDDIGDFLQALAAALEDFPDFDGKPRSEVFDGQFSRLLARQRWTSIEPFCAWLRESAVPSDEDCPFAVHRCDDLAYWLNRGLAEVLPQCPFIEELIVFKDLRSAGVDFKRDEVHALFSEEECFERRLSEVGERLAELLGENSLDVSHWVEDSF